LLKQQRFDAILLTLASGAGAALDAIAALDRAAPATPVLALAESDDPLLGELALRSGAEDCLVASQLDGRALLRAVRFARERRCKLDKLNHQAWTDALTGLPNRALLRDRLASVVARAHRYDSIAGVLFIDLDGFKQVNDSIGHAGGDLLLRRVAERLQSAVRVCDTVARLGGDEFVVALENLGHPADAEAVADCIRARIEHPFRIRGQAVQISASIGIALLGVHADDVDGLLRHADSRMYEAKRARAAARVPEPAASLRSSSAAARNDPPPA
jgi:diguanylate cyclase (GGDEF)-like protein